MAYGDYDGPDKADKGKENGSCNRGRCQAADAIWFNHGSLSWYCADCRENIEFDPFNLRGWRLDHEPKCGHPMFETREMMEARLAILVEGADTSMPKPAEISAMREIMRILGMDLDERSREAMTGVVGDIRSAAADMLFAYARRHAEHIIKIEPMAHWDDPDIGRLGGNPGRKDRQLIAAAAAGPAEVHHMTRQQARAAARAAAKGGRA